MKTALELAMERASKISVDKEAQAKDKQTQEGMRLAALLFNNDLVSFQQAYDNLETVQKKESLGGILKVFLANIVLPASPEQHSRITLVCSAFMLIEPSCEPIVIALNEVLSTYQNQATELAEHLRTQIENLLATKEEKYFRQTGQRIAFTMESDKEAMALYQKQFNEFQTHYQTYINNIKNELSVLLMPVECAK
jgi:hypothetical protein